MAEGARLESVYTATYRGFESLSLRQIQKKPPLWRFFAFREGFIVKIIPAGKLIPALQVSIKDDGESLLFFLNFPAK